MDREQLEERVEEAVRIAKQHDEEFRPAIILGVLLGGMRVRRQEQPVGREPENGRPEAEGEEAHTTNGAEILQPVVEDTGIPLDDLQRIVVLKEGKKFEIGGQDVGVRSKSGRQNRWSAIYCYLKEKVYGDYEVESEELIELCRSKRCYDRSNFAQNFRTNPFLSELGGRTDKRYRLTNDGENTAKELLHKLTGHEGG